MFWLLACSIDPAPADVDGLAHWSWVNYDQVTADDMAEAADTLRGFDDSDGGITDLLPDEVAHLGLDVPTWTRPEAGTSSTDSHAISMR